MVVGKLLPRIGLLSDSHGRAATTRRAVQLLLEQGAEVLLHLGDVGSVEVIDELAPTPDHPVDSHLVFGNTDWDIQSLAQYAATLDVRNNHPVGVITLDDGGELVFTHGDRPDAIDEALARKVRYLCHGHTHRATDTRRGPTRVINPGALFRARSYTVAVLDTQRDALSFHAVDGL